MVYRPKWIVPAFLGVGIFMHVTTPPVARAAIPKEPLQKPARIRVRLAEATPVAAIRGYDLQLFEAQPGTPAHSPERKLARQLDRSTQWEFRCQGDRVRAIQVGGARSLDLRSPVTLQTPAGFLHFRGRPYRDELRIHANGSLCEVINDVDLEKYLNGLVNMEFSSRWNEEAIAAQIVAARTYALYQIRQAREQHFDVDGSVRDQVYDGSTTEDTRASRAVERTRGLVLLAQAGKDGPEPLKAFYHSTCGGQTELPQQVWGSAFPGFKRSVACPFCAKSPAMNWELSLSAEEIRSALLKGARADDAAPKGWPKDWPAVLRSGKLLGVQVTRFDSAGRVAELRLDWTQANRFISLGLTGARFRDWIGPARFRSTLFQITATPARWSFRGRGNGHGVGMCQYGAKGMGERGFTMAAILKHYYPDAELRKLW